MYGSRTSRLVDARGGLDYSPSGLMSRRPASYRGSEGIVARGSRNKPIVDDMRLGNSRGSLRGSDFFSGGSKGRVDVERSGHYRDDDMNAYDPISERRFRDEGLIKVVRSVDDGSLRGDDGVRIRDGSSRRVEKLVRPELADEARWASKRLNRTSSYDDEISSRERDYHSHGRSPGSGGPVLSGIILDCQRHTILEFSAEKGIFELPFNDRRLSEQIGPGTKVFMFESVAREIHGVFQVESYADIDDESPRRALDVAVVRVRVLKQCVPLSERQFKEVIRDNYYTKSLFSESLTKEQVMKLLQIFRQVDPARSMQLSLPSSRRALELGVGSTKQDFDPLSPEDMGLKRRRDPIDARAARAHGYRAQDSPRFLPRASLQGVSSRSLEDYEDYVDDDALEDVSHSKARMYAASNSHAVTRTKHQSVRGLSNAGPGGGHYIGGMSRSESHLATPDWPEDDLDTRENYRKRQVSPPKGMGRGTRSSSPTWKETLLRIAPLTDGEYDSLNEQLGYRDDMAYISKRGHPHNEMDLNKSVELGYTEPALVRDVDSKAVRRRVWIDDELKKPLVSAARGRSDVSRSALHLTGHFRDADFYDDPDEFVLDSRHMATGLQVDDKSHLQAEEKVRLAPGSYSNGKVLKPRQRTVVITTSNEKPVTSSLLRKKTMLMTKEVHKKGLSFRTTKAPSFQIKAKLHSVGRGRPDRMVTMVDDEDGRTRGTESSEGVIPGSSRKQSVWSRISPPEGGPIRKISASSGRGRVFTRLGPNSHSTSLIRNSRNPKFGRGEEDYGAKAKRPRLEEREGDSDMRGSSPDALADEDYLRDDSDVSEDFGQEVEKSPEEIQGWNRKKLSAVKICEDGQALEIDEKTTAKGGRRKLVRPVIGERQKGEKERKGNPSAPIVAAKDSNTLGECHNSHSYFTKVGAPDKGANAALSSPQNLGVPAEKFGSEIEVVSVIS